MKRDKYLFERIPNSLIFLFIFILFFSKIIFYISVKSELILPGFIAKSDADYYHNYAMGYVNVATNSWPVLLKYLNNFNLYSREVISYILFLISLILIPLITCKISGLSFKINQKYYLYLWLLCLLYPSIFLFTFDIYRDVFMVFSFLIGCLIVKKCLDSSSFLPFISYLSISIVIGIFLLDLRPYLGYAFLLSLFLWKIRFTKKRLVFLGFLYFLALFIINYAGFLEVLTEYRAGFEEGGGGSTLGLDFSNPVMFIPNFILSMLGQLFGLYVISPLAIVLLVVETVPFFFMLIYIIKNIKLANSFVRFLIVFFVLYASVWLIGNDNLGTAVRLRLYNYFAVYIGFFYILRLKNLSSQ